MPLPLMRGPPPTIATAAAAASRADTFAAERERLLWRRRKEAHKKKVARRFVRLKPLAPKRRGVEPLRPFTREQMMAARVAMSDEFGTRAVIAALPVPMMMALAQAAKELEDGYVRGGRAFSSRMIRKATSTLGATLFMSRPSERDGYALVTTGLGREGILKVMGAALESGEEYSVSALSNTDTGSLPFLEELGVMLRTQVPASAVPACDRGCERSYAFNHYLFTDEMVPEDDQWGMFGNCLRPNPSAPRELLEYVCPWLALSRGEHLTLARARAAVEALARDAMAADPAHNFSDVLNHGADPALEAAAAEDKTAALSADPRPPPDP